MTDLLVLETLMGEDLDLGVDTTSKTHASGGTVPGTQVSLTTLSRRGPNGTADTVAWDPGSIAAAQSEQKTLTVTGAALGDLVLASFSLALGGCILSAEVSAADTVTATIVNPTTAAVDLGSGTLKALVFQVR